MIPISSKSAAAELRRYKRRQAALKSRLNRLIDAYAGQAAAGVERIPDSESRELHLLMRDLLAITRDEFEEDGADRICGDGCIGAVFKAVSNEDELDYTMPLPDFTSMLGLQALHAAPPRTVNDVKLFAPAWDAAQTREFELDWKHLREWILLLASYGLTDPEILAELAEEWPTITGVDTCAGGARIIVTMA